VARKKREEEHENHERWLVSYADFITLLFAFFVVMYSVSRVDNKRLAQASNAIRWALHFEGTGGITTMPLFEGPPSEGGCSANVGPGMQVTKKKRAQQVDLLKNRLEKKLRSLLNEQKSTVSVEAEGTRLAVRLGASRFFDPGAAMLRPEALPVLDAIAAELKALDRPIRAEGHTDGAMLTSPRFRNNWELSAGRAATVVAYLEQAHHIRPDSLSAVGHGATNPVASDDTPEGREANRRVELVVELDPDNPLSFANR
jgi:chemotaxis protein MotB